MITAPGLPQRSQDALSAGTADATQASRYDRTFSRQYSFEHGAAEVSTDRPIEKPAERQTEQTKAKTGDALLAQTPSEYEEAALIGKEFDPHAIWQMLLSELALQMPSATYSTWVRDTWVIAYEDGEFIIGLPNAYARDWLENRLRHKIKRVLSALIHRSVQVQFRVCPRTVSDSPNAAPTPLYQTHDGEPPAYMNTRNERTLPSGEPAPSPVVAGHSQQAQGRAQETVMVTRSQLNSYYTFETFVVGSHNKLAHAAAEAIAERPGQSFNPLFVYGGVGLGKTHLLHAIGQRALQLGYRMLYCSSEQFTNELIGAIRNQNTDEFRNKYRQVDILLIDDIQFIAGKESTQEEFFHTFNYLHAGGRQVVLSSDRPPKALATLDDRLRSRFEGGLQTDISQPDFETRVAILQCKAKRMNANVDHSVLMMIAERVDSNIRELEGALNRLTIQARLVNSPLNLSLATAIIDNLAPERTPCAPAALVRLVAAHFQLKADDLTGRKRTKEIAYARQIAMFLLREEHALSLPAIGDQLGGRDHSTVRYGIEKVAADLNEDEALRQAITTLREKIYVPFAV
ncbi:MAG: chromosomal replication initiator protein DnaA [Caldilinea sp. CFX5]|nr:chromosomal replication initiator protein DnaA [Caldilinea sp. CFX5]